jgi:replicative DNA helicase
VIDNGSRTALRTTPRRLFTEDEHFVLDFVLNYIQQYGGLPSMQIVRENGLNLPVVDGPLEYHIDRLGQRGIYNAYATRQQMLHEALQSGQWADVRNIIAEMNTEISAVDVRRDTFTLEETLQAAWEEYVAARDNPGMRGIPYGIPTVDLHTQGAREGDVGTIVARPGLGKSTLLLLICLRAWLAGFSAAFVSMEMGAIETARRAISILTGVNPDFLMRGQMSGWAEDAVVQTLQRVAGLPPFHIMVGDLSKSVNDVDNLIMELGPDLVGLDASYLLKPTPGNMFKGKRHEAAADVAADVKGVALRRNRPIIQTVQFNRGQVEEEEMGLHQIGGTDVFGQVSSLVVGIKRGPAPFERSRRRGKIIKNRHGQDHIDFTLNFLFDPFNMEEVFEEEAPDLTRDWDGTTTTAPPQTEWTDV